MKREKTIQLLFLIISCVDVSSWTSINREFHGRRYTKLYEQQYPSSDLIIPHSGLVTPTSSSELLTPRKARIINPLQGMTAAQILATSLGTGALPAFADNPDTLSVKNKIEKHFPSVVSISDVPKILQKTLPGFTKGNTLLGMSLCSDEINADFVKALQQYYGPAFILGGLGGVPFVGVSGMGAAVSHIPDQGKFLVVVASHVGYSPVMNALGKVRREGRDNLSGACGAAIGALGKVLKKGDAPDNGIQDAQEDFIIRKLLESKKSTEFPDQDSSIAWVTYEVLGIAMERMKSIIDPLIATTKFSNQNLAVLGGVLINRGTEGEDLFQPTSFEVSGQDYFRKAFGYASPAFWIKTLG